MRVLGGPYVKSLVGVAASGVPMAVFAAYGSSRLGIAAFSPQVQSLAGAMIVAQLSMTTVAPTLAWHTSRTDEPARDGVARTAVRYHAAVSLVAGLAYVALALVGVFPNETSFVVGGALTAAVYSFYFATKTLLIALDRMATYVRYEVAACLMFLAVLVVTVERRPSASLLAFPLAYSIFILAAALVIARCAAPVHIAIRPLVPTAVYSGVGTYSSAALVPLLVVLTGHVADARAAVEIATISAILQPLYIFSYASGMLALFSPARVARTSTRARGETRRIAWFGVGVAVVAVAFGGTLLERVLGAEWADSGDVVRQLGSVLVLRLVGMPIAASVSATGRWRPIALTTALSAVICLGMAAVLAPRWGASGSAFAYGLSSLVLVASIVRIGRTAGISEVDGAWPAFACGSIALVAQIAVGVL